MSDLVEPDASGSSSQSKVSRLERSGWRAKGRWFAAEYLIIVTGVLTAAAVNAWWQGRQEVTQERSYLVQLVEDLRQTERIMTLADSAELRASRAIGRLERAFYLSERPPRDSLLMWIYGSSWIRPVRPVLGTAEALVSTGDLRLIRDDSLRAAVTAYLDDTRRLMAHHEASAAEWLAGLRALHERGDRAALLLIAAQEDSLARTSPFWPLPDGPRRDPFPFDAEGFLTDREAFAATVQMSDAKGQLETVRQWVRERSATLRARVEGELGS